MKLQVQAGTTDFTTLVWLGDSSSTTGAGLASVAHTDITVYYARVETDNDVTSAALSMSALTALTDAHSDGGWYEVDGTNQPGLYRIDLSDAVLAAGAWSVVVTIIDAASNNIAPLNMEIQLTAYDPYDSVRLGMTALPNAAADAPGGLPISDAGALDLDALNAAAVRLTAARAQAIDDWINGGRLDLILDELTTQGDTNETAIGNLNDPTAAAVADQVWEETLADHSGTSGSTAEALNAAGAAGDPWSTAIPGAYGAGSAGLLLGTTIPNTLSTTDGKVDTAQADLDVLTGTDGATLATSQGNYAPATATALSTAQSDLDTLTGTDGATLATSQPNYAPATSTALSTHDGKLDTLTTNVGNLNDFDPTSDAVANVTLVDTTTTNTDMRGTDSAATAANVNAQVLDVLNVDTFAEPGQGAPAATATLAAKINYLYKWARNKLEQTSTTLSIYDDAGTTVDQKSTISDDGTTYTRGEIGTGP